MKKYDNLVKIGFNIAALALVILGILQAFAPYIGLPDSREAEVRQAIQHVIAVPANKVADLLRDPDGKPVMLVMYASWCGPCRAEMPHIASLIKDGSLNRVKPVFLSMDYDLRAFTIYLVHNDYHTLFPAYLLKGSSPDLQHSLKATGSNFAGHIPYIAFFDTQGKFITELTGMLGSRELLKAVSSLP